MHGSKIKFRVPKVIPAIWFLTFELPLLFEVPKEPDVDDERHDGRQGDAEAHEDGEALAEGDRVLPLLVVCGQIRKFNKCRRNCSSSLFVNNKDWYLGGTRRTEH